MLIVLLHVVSKCLFFLLKIYPPIVSGQLMLMYVPLLGIRFAILFIVCLIIFMILNPFNIILSFMRYQDLKNYYSLNHYRMLIKDHTKSGSILLDSVDWCAICDKSWFLCISITGTDKNINLTISAILLHILQ